MMTHEQYLAEQTAIRNMYSYDSEVVAYKLTELDRSVPLTTIYPSLAHKASTPATSTHKEHAPMALTDEQERDIERLTYKYADNPRLQAAVIAKATEVFETLNASPKSSAPSDLAERITNRTADLIANGQSVADATRNATRAEHVRAGLPIPPEFQTLAELSEPQDTTDVAHEAEVAAKNEFAEAEAEVFEAERPGGVSVERGNLRAQRARLEAQQAEEAAEVARKYTDNGVPAEQAQSMAETHAKALYAPKLAELDASIKAINAKAVAAEASEDEESEEGEAE